MKESETEKIPSAFLPKDAENTKTLPPSGMHRTNEMVRWRVNFSLDAIAEIEDYLDGNRDFCKKQMAKKAPPALPPNWAVDP